MGPSLLEAANERKEEGLYNGKKATTCLVSVILIWSVCSKIFFFSI